jgi:hypothetical protein
MVDVSVHAFEIEIRDADTRHLVIGLVLMLGYYAPFWIGEPFLPALSAPNTPAAIVHIAMALFTCVAIFAARPFFRSTEDVKS